VAQQTAALLGEGLQRPAENPFHAKTVRQRLLERGRVITRIRNRKDASDEEEDEADT